jgi:hypothetical protein
VTGKGLSAEIMGLKKLGDKKINLEFNCILKEKFEITDGNLDRSAKQK